MDDAFKYADELGPALGQDARAAAERRAEAVVGVGEVAHRPQEVVRAGAVLVGELVGGEALDELLGHAARERERGEAVREHRGLGGRGHGGGSSLGGWSAGRSP